MLAPKAIGAGVYLGDASSRSSSSAAPSLANRRALEIEPGGEAHIGVGRPGVAIEAAVLAAAIGVDRAVERDVGRLVAGDDRPGLLPGHLGRERLGRLVARPAVVELLAPLESRSGRRRWSPRRARAGARRAGCVRRSPRACDAGQRRRRGSGSGSWAWTVIGRLEQIMNRRHSPGPAPRQGRAASRERSKDAR